MTSAPRLVLTLLVAVVACQDIALDNVKDGGSTVPVPDMDGPVSFAENALTGAVETWAI